MYSMFSDLEQDYTCQDNIESKQLAVYVAPHSCCELIACEREPGSTVGIYYGSQDKYDLLDTKKVVTHLPPVTYGYRTRGNLTQNN